MAKTTDIASGANSAPPTPPRNRIGTNTMQIDRVETNAGVATSAAPSRMACLSGLPRSMWRGLFFVSAVGPFPQVPPANALPPTGLTVSDWVQIFSKLTQGMSAIGVDHAPIKGLPH